MLNIELAGDSKEAKEKTDEAFSLNLAMLLDRGVSGTSAVVT